MAVAKTVGQQVKTAQVPAHDEGPHIRREAAPLSDLYGELSIVKNRKRRKIDGLHAVVNRRCIGLIPATVASCANSEMGSVAIRASGGSSVLY